MKLAILISYLGFKGLTKSPLDKLCKSLNLVEKNCTYKRCILYTEDLKRVYTDVGAPRSCGFPVGVNPT
jgi:hypothetical protein